MDHVGQFKRLVEKLFELNHTDLAANIDSPVKSSVKLCNFLKSGLIKKNLERNTFEIVIISNLKNNEGEVLELNEKGLTEDDILNLIPYIQTSYPNVNTVEDLLSKLEEEIISNT